MDNKIQQLFFETVQAKLRFLVTEFQFTGPYSSFDSNVYQVWYLAKNLGIEFRIENRTINCYIFRLASIKSPTSLNVNSQEDSQKVELSNWVRNTGVRDRLFRLTDLSLQEEIPIIINDYVGMLKKYGRKILEDSPDVLSNPDEIPSLFSLFLETIREKLSFLATFGFTGPYTNYESGDKLNSYEVSYKAKNLAIEFHLDLRDQDIACYISRLVDGKIPSDWAINEHGEIVRMRLSSWLGNKDVQDSSLTRVTGSSYKKDIPITIGNYVELIQKHGQNILADRPDIFSRWE